MATFKGKNGVVKSGSNAVAEIRGFTVEEKGDVVDDTVMGDTWKSHLPTFKEWSASVDVLFDDTDTNGQTTLAVGASLAMSFLMEGTANGSHSLAGTCTVTGRTITATYDGLVEAALTVTGNGALAESTVSA